MSSLMRSLQENELKTKKERAVKQYLEAEERYGEEHNVTLLRKGLLQMLIVVQQMNESVNSFKDVLDVIQEFDNSIEEISQLSLDAGYLSKLNGKPKWLQKILIPHYREKERRAIRAKVQPLINQMESVSMRITIFSEVSQEVIGILADVMTPKASKKSKKSKKPTPLTDVERMTNEAIEQGRHPGQSFSGGGSMNAGVGTAGTGTFDGTAGASGDQPFNPFGG